MSSLRLRDRDAIVTNEGLIFRVFGYSHPPNAFVCDAEYAPSELFKSSNPKAPRTKNHHVFYKFYEDEGWKFIQQNYPRYLIFHDMLQSKVTGVNRNHIRRVLKPEEELWKLLTTGDSDELVAALQKVLGITTSNSGLSTRDFGVFGSMLHGFHHPQFSDIDLIVYGREKARELCRILHELHGRDSSMLTNEFETEESIKGKPWRFQNFTAKEFVWHQRRKLIYALFNDANTGRVIKTEFEPVKNWEEISNDYDSETRIVQKGWIKALARITEDADSPFIPSIYGIEPLKVLEGAKSASEALRIVSYMEEFRIQARKDEVVYVEGNLEEVTSHSRSFHQVTLTYCPRYYEQVMKLVSQE